MEALWRFKHPRYPSVGVESNRWGERPRHDLGLPSGGTVYFCDARERHMIGPIIRCPIPYHTYVEGAFDTERHRQVKGSGETGETIRGWRALFVDLAKGGFLYPSVELSEFIGEDSFAIIERKHWL